MSARFALMRQERNRHGFDEHRIVDAFTAATEGELLDALQDRVEALTPRTALVPQNDEALTMLLEMSVAVQVIEKAVSP